MDKKISVFEEEKNHLTEVQAIINEQLLKVESDQERRKSDIQDQKRYLWENVYELDPEEIASNRALISEDHEMYEFFEDSKRLLLKLKDNSYFGRIDFIYENEDVPETLYIGLGSLKKSDSVDNVIYDWRAPVSSMFYDFDKGFAYYEAPGGRIEGTLVKKRQLKVRKGQLEYALDSDVKIDDEILQKELSSNGSVKMRNIVATIQREQNSIVRNQSALIMVVQGVAGSGKTSIALHRIAYLLYQNRNNLSSSEVLIISPNRIFADYISNVLPELGEQNISEVSFDEIAAHELDGITKYETKYQQLEYIANCDKKNNKRIKEIRFKNSYAFVNEMKVFVSKIEGEIIRFNDFKLDDYTIGKEQLEDMYFRVFKNYPIFERLSKMAERIADLYESRKNVRISEASRKGIQDSIISTTKYADVLDIYDLFIRKMAEEYSELRSNRIDRSELLYEDVFPVVLMKFLLFGSVPLQFKRIKHVIVDEMQDYTAAQYQLLKLLFKCKMTILGDVDQVVDRNEQNVVDTLKAIFGEDIVFVKMMKTYRSSFEISEFCRKIAGVDGIKSFERHGEKPIITECENSIEMIKKIESCMDDFKKNNLTTQVYICKTALQAEELYKTLDDTHKADCYLMNSPDDMFKEGIIITNSYLVKGLEFDSVVIPNADNNNYVTEQDKQILYISCTRALHELRMFFVGTKSKYIEQALDEV